AYVFRRTASGWAQETKLTAADALPGARFGDAVAAEGDRVFVGVPRDSAAFYGGGAVYVFARDAGTGTWVEEAKLLPSDLGTSYRFGVAVAVVGDLLAVGAPRATGAGFDTGAVYVFRRDATSGAWVEEAKLFSDTIGFDNVFGLDLALASGPAGEFVVANEAPKFDRFTAYVFARTGDPDGPNGGWGAWGRTLRRCTRSTARADRAAPCGWRKRCSPSASTRRPSMARSRASAIQATATPVWPTSTSGRPMPAVSCGWSGRS